MKVILLQTIFRGVPAKDHTGAPLKGTAIRGYRRQEVIVTDTVRHLAGETVDLPDDEVKELLERNLARLPVAT